MPRTKKKLESIGKPITKTTQTTDQRLLHEPVNISLKKDKSFDWLPLEYVSYSMLDSFAKCPVCWFMQYYCGVQWPMNLKMDRGVNLQEALNLKYKGEDYTSEIQKLDDGDRLDALIKKLDDIEDLISIDVPHIVDFGLGIPVKFTPDFLSKTKVIDAKLSSGYYNSKSVQTMQQLTIYKEGAKRLFGIDTRLFYWIFNDKKYTFEEVEVVRTEQDVENMIKWFSETLNDIKKCYDSKSWVIPKHSRFKCNLGVACPILKG